MFSSKYSDWLHKILSILDFDLVKTCAEQLIFRGMQMDENNPSERISSHFDGSKIGSESG